MSNIIAGYFNKSVNYKTIESQLENAGFSSSDYIIYLDDNANTYLASVKIADETKAEKAKEIFTKNSSSPFSFSNIDDAISYQQLKTLIDEKAKLEIKEVPGITALTADEGIDDQPTFGDNDQKTWSE